MPYIDGLLPATAVAPADLVVVCQGSTGAFGEYVPGSGTDGYASVAMLLAGLNLAEVVSFNGRIGVVVLTGADVDTALGYTPYNAANPSAYQTAAQVTATLLGYQVALGFVPYNATNPAGYQTAAQVAASIAAALSGYATQAYVLSYLADYFTGTSETGNYCQRFPGGITIQFGVAATPAGGMAILTFPYTFPNDCLGQMVCLNTTTPSSFNVGTESPTRTGMTIYSTTGTGTPCAANFYWLAIGN